MFNNHLCNICLLYNFFYLHMRFPLLVLHACYFPSWISFPCILQREKSQFIFIYYLIFLNNISIHNSKNPVFQLIYKFKIWKPCDFFWFRKSLCLFVGFLITIIFVTFFTMKSCLFHLMYFKERLLFWMSTLNIHLYCSC